MKALGVILLTGVAITMHAQYKAPSQYFRKDFPAPNQAQQGRAVGNPQPTQAPQTPQTPPATPRTAQPQAKFRDVSTNSQFYFLTDTNHAYPWTKISATVATNTKTGARQSFSPEMPVQH